MKNIVKNGKSEITIRSIDAVASGMPVLAHIVDGDGKGVGYWIDRLPSDFGVALRFRKIGELDEPYDVCVEGESYTCDCKGRLRHGHCKHGETALRMIASGSEPTSAPRPEAAEERPGKIDADADLWARLDELDPSAASRYRAAEAHGRLSDGALARAVGAAEHRAAHPFVLEDL